MFVVRGVYLGWGIYKGARLENPTESVFLILMGSLLIGFSISLISASSWWAMPTIYITSFIDVRSIICSLICVLEGFGIAYGVRESSSSCKTVFAPLVRKSEAFDSEKLKERLAAKNQPEFVEDPKKRQDSLKNDPVLLI